MPKFSTSTDVSGAVHHLSLMNAMSHFFKFRCHTDCGIAKVRLDGDLEDWEKLGKSIEALREYDLSWWVDGISWIIDNIIDTYKGNGK